jgi:hypothetical protein
VQSTKHSTLLPQTAVFNGDYEFPKLIAKAVNTYPSNETYYPGK